VTIVDPVIPSRRRVAVIGHRGSRATHPENTIEAFEYARRAGVDAVELDVTPTRDGVLAVTHDAVWGDFAELPAGVPRIEELVEYATGNSLFLDIEAKSHPNASLAGEEYARALGKAVAPLAGRVALRSFNRRLLRMLNGLAADIPLIVLTRRSAIRWVRIAKRTHARAISPHRWLVTPAEVRRAHRAGLPVYAWTVNREREWLRMLRAGVDGIITDDPAALIRFLEQSEPLSQAIEDAGP
jgi:glycerophosphoryl diester phosphodiesterase